MTLHIDLETYSAADLKKVGMHRYMADPTFKPLMCAYAIDDGPVGLADFTAGESLPYFILTFIEDPYVTKKAWNASFEMGCLGASDYRGWECTAVHAAYLALPRSLGQACEVMRLPVDKAKDKDGKALINYFCKPCKPTKANGGRTRNLPKHDPEKWERFKEYCKQDVEAAREMDRKLSAFPVPESEWAMWRLDQAINQRGIRVDLPFVRSAMKVDSLHREQLLAEAVALTGLSNPNSVSQLTKWLEEETDEKVESLTKESVAGLLTAVSTPHVTRMLEIRQELSKSSVKKYRALYEATCPDGRIRGTLLFYGATHTGRWCLAEGTLVRTNRGDIPIESVTSDDLVWDGESWVKHDGVVYSGDKDVIAWDGVTATPEHVVWGSPDEKISLGEARETCRKLWAGY